jgi:hypothetical protein
MELAMIQAVWFWCSEVSGEDLSQPPSVVVGMKVDDVAIEA